MYAGASQPERRKRDALSLQAMRDSGEKIAMLTCYDASFAALCDQAGVDVLLVGDSLGMVVQGESSTLPVTLDQMRYHVACVARGLANASGKAWLIGDLPFASYHASPAIAHASAAVLMQAGAQMVKLEGAGHDNAWLVETIAFLIARGIPVCAHLGLTPQSVHQLGGYRVQGKDDAAAARLLSDAKAMEAAGATMLVLELVPSALADTVTAALRIPTIGIGAGPGCSGQVLVLHDMLGVYPGRKARFVKNFVTGDDGVPRDLASAIGAYVTAVRDGSFPAAEHGYR
ncbi:MAG: 3-methyl-2-oxobutanoate hydroxymethyltransferase [Burkholderiaceae bacterium]